MKNYRVIQGIILLIALHLVPGALIASNPMQGVKSLADIPPKTSVLSDGTKVTITTGEGVTVQNRDGTVERYIRQIGSDGTVVYSSTTPGSSHTIKCTTNGCGDNKIFSEALTKGALDGSSTNNGPRTVIVSAKVPGASCKCYVGGREGDDTCPSDTPVDQIKYKCEVGEGLSGFQSMFASIIRYTVNIVLILSVLAIIGLGIAWTMAGGDDIKAKSSLKSWAINICIGLIILFFFRYILQFLAPWIYK